MCACGDILTTTGSNPQSVESQFHSAFEYKSSFITFPLDFLFMHSYAQNQEGYNVDQKH